MSIAHGQQHGFSGQLTQVARADALINVFKLVRLGPFSVLLKTVLALQTGDGVALDAQGVDGSVAQQRCGDAACCQLVVAGVDALQSLHLAHRSWQRR